MKLSKSSGIANLPLFPRFRVDEEDKCDPTITSVFGDAVYYRRDLEVYPNPSNGIFNIVIPSDFSKGQLLVYNVNGEIVYDHEVSNGTIRQQINLYGLPVGHYNVELYPAVNNDRIYYGRQVIKLE